MYIHEHTMLLMAKERIEAACRSAEQLRALRPAGAPRRPVRVHLGMALIRLGHRVIGHSPPPPAPSIILQERPS
jgi:hypothetical protein